MHIVRGHLTRFLTGKIKAEYQQLGVDMTNAHWLKIAIRLERVNTNMPSTLKIIPPYHHVFFSSTVYHKSRHKKPAVVNQLPEVGLEGMGDVSIVKGPQGEVHVFADPDDDVTIHRHDSTGMVSYFHTQSCSCYLGCPLQIWTQAVLSKVLYLYRRFGNHGVNVFILKGL